MTRNDRARHLPTQLPRWVEWAPPVLVLVSLLGLLLVPLLILRWTETLREEIEQATAPARDIIDEVQIALAQQVAAKRGFLLTGDEDQIERYNQAAEYGSEMLERLATIDRDLRPTSRERIAELREAFGDWQAVNAALLDRTRAAEMIEPDLGINQVLYDRALNAAVRAGDAIAVETRARLAEISATQRLSMVAAIVFTVLALFSAATVFWIGVRARRLAIENLERAEREVELRRRAEAAVRARDEMLAVVSHDLRNPLNTIVLTADLVLATSLQPEDREAKIGVIRRTAMHMERLIRDLLDVARIEAGRALAVEPTPQAPASLVLDACETHRPQAGEKGVTIESRIDPDLPDVLADRERIEQVFSNLIGNAIKFTAEGGRVTVVAASTGEGARFDVADTGPGIGADVRERIFEPFWQEGNQARLGTGLGLAIVRGIVEEHGGRVWVESEPGVGSTFSFTLPAAVRLTPPAAP